MSSIIERKFFYSFIFFLVLVIGGLTVFTRHTVSLDRCKQAPNVLMGGKVFSVSVADTPESRSLGLSGTTILPPDTGMLFVYDSTSEKQFWMKDMMYPIDIIWIDRDWLVTGVQSSIKPDSYPSLFTSPSNTLYVLEVNAGVAEALNIKEGSFIQNESKCLNPDL